MRRFKGGREKKVALAIVAALWLLAIGAVSGLQ
jgi:hypothetical protein